LALGTVLAWASACGGQSTLAEGDREPVAGNGGDTGTGGASTGGTASGGVSSGGTSSGGVSSGGTSSGGVPGATPGSCALKACGSPCAICPSGDLPCDPAMFCDALGMCTTARPECPNECASARDCPEIDVACLSCPDGSSVCPQIECARGVCLPSSVTCPECAEDSECPAPPLQCKTCADGSMSCPKGTCYRGTCGVSWTGGCVDFGPCIELACGAACNPCTLPECPPLEAPHFCNWKGVCAPEPGGCGEQCKSASDCPPPPPSCGACPADTCLGEACVNETCVLVCR